MKFINITLFIFSIVLFTAVLFHKTMRLRFFWQKVCLISVGCLLLLGSVFHTRYYGVLCGFGRKVAIDQECFYYPQKLTYPSDVKTITKEVLQQITKLQRSNAVYRLIYWNIRKIFGNEYFIEGFFFCCILNGILFLFSVCILFRIFDCFDVSNRFLYLCCFIIFQPFMILKNSIPLANSLTIFSLVLFIYTMVTNRRLSLKLLSLVLCFLAHKTLWLPVICTSFYLLFVNQKNARAKIVTSLLILGGVIYIFRSNLHVFQQDLIISQKYMVGESYIPATICLKKILNMYLSPLWTNLTLFLYKTPNGNFWGWIYAIYCNFIFLFMFVKICFSFKNFFCLTQPMQRTCIVLSIFIISFSAEGIRLNNYLNANRHAVNSLVVWVSLMLVLESAKTLKMKTKELEKISK